MSKIMKIASVSLLFLTLTACSNGKEASKLNQTYAQLTSAQKSQISGRSGSLKNLTLTKKDQAAYTFPEKYLGKHVLAVHFNAKDEVMGEVIYLVYDGKIIGQNLRD